MKSLRLLFTFSLALGLAAQQVTLVHAMDAQPGDGPVNVLPPATPEELLFQAAIRPNFNDIYTAANAGANIYARNNFGFTGLHLAAGFGCNDIVTELLSIPDIDRPLFLHLQDPHGRTALHLAALYGHTTTVMVLLSAGAYADAQDSDGNTALHLAALYGHTHTVIALLNNIIVNRVAFVNIQNHAGRTALLLAAAFGRTAIVSLLLNKGADTTLCDTFYNTALHYAAYFDNPDSVMALLSADADSTMLNIFGMTPAAYARRNNHDAVATIIEHYQTTHHATFLKQVLHFLENLLGW